MKGLTPKSPLAIQRESRRVKKLHLANVRLFSRGKAQSERDYYMAMGAHQALAWAAGDNALRPSVACAPSPILKSKRRSAPSASAGANVQKETTEI